MGICNVLFAFPLSGNTTLGISGVFGDGVGANFSGIGPGTSGVDTTSGVFSATTGSSLIFFLSLPVEKLHRVPLADPVQ